LCGVLFLMGALGALSFYVKFKTRCVLNKDCFPLWEYTVAFCS